MDLEHTDKETTIIVNLSSDHRYYVNSDRKRVSIAPEERLHAHRAQGVILTPETAGSVRVWTRKSIEGVRRTSTSLIVLRCYRSQLSTLFSEKKFLHDRTPARVLVNPSAAAVFPTRE